MINWDETVTRVGEFKDFLDQDCIIKLSKKVIEPKLHLGLSCYVTDSNEEIILPLMVLNQEIAKELVDVLLCFIETGDI